MRTTLIAVALSLVPWATTLPAVMSTGCMGCTNIGVDSGLTLNLAAAPGRYQIKATADGETLSQRFELTADNFFCDPTTCSATGVGSMLLVEWDGGDAVRARVAHREGGSGPRAVVLQILHDDVLVHESTIIADYETVYPNGSNCDPGADVASVDVVVP